MAWPQGDDEGVTAMKRLVYLAFGAAVAVATLAVLAGPASGHEFSGATITCNGVSGAFHDFGASDHPVTWHVKVGTGSFQAVATAESPPNFTGSGTATADISTMTAELHGSSATVQAFATWPSGQSATTSAVLTCGTPELAPVSAPPSTAPPQVSGIQATAPGSSGVSTLVTPAAPVPAAANFTG
jgi:hypothetical protein